jgi:hypothetical protein
LLELGVDKVFLFQLFDEEWDTRGMGLLDDELRPRDACDALCGLASLSGERQVAASPAS